MNQCIEVAPTSCIESKLDFFLKSGKIPNIIFHGSSGSGKRTILHNFLNKIYDGDRDKLKSNIMMVNCSHGKGIKFIRDELKFFAKTNIRTNSGIMFKSIVLLNADSLTIDAQSALRRCIELFSNNTRFFIVVEKIQRLLNPILSRFCEIYIPEKCFITDTDKNRCIEDTPVGASYPKDTCIYSLHKYNIEQLYKIKSLSVISTQDYILKVFENIGSIKSPLSLHNSITILVQESTTLYENGISALDIINTLKCIPYIQTNIYYWNDITGDKVPVIMTPEASVIRNTLITMCFYKIKPDLRCEKMMIFYILYFFFISSDDDIKNILLV